MFLLKVRAQRAYGRGGASRRLGAAASLSVFEQALEECQHFSRQNRLKKHPDEGRYPNPVLLDEGCYPNQIKFIASLVSWKARKAATNSRPMENQRHAARSRAKAARNRAKAALRQTLHILRRPWGAGGPF